MDTERVQPSDDQPELEPLQDALAPERSTIGGEPERDQLKGELGEESENVFEDIEDRHEEDDDQERALGGFQPESPPADLEGLVHYVVSKLVSDPEAIEISSEQRGGTMYIALRVPEADLGRVIGREGRTAKAIRTLVSIAGSKSNVHARLDIDG